MRLLDKNRLFSQTNLALGVAQDLYKNISNLPIISPHDIVIPVGFLKQKISRPCPAFCCPGSLCFSCVSCQGSHWMSLEYRLRMVVFSKTIHKNMEKFSENYYLSRNSNSNVAWLFFWKDFGITELLTPAPVTFITASLKKNYPNLNTCHSFLIDLTLRFYPQRTQQLAT